MFFYLVSCDADITGDMTIIYLGSWWLIELVYEMDSCFEGGIGVCMWRRVQFRRLLFVRLLVRAG